MAQFGAESVAHITAECLDQFAPEYARNEHEPQEAQKKHAS